MATINAIIQIKFSEVVKSIKADYAAGVLYDEEHRARCNVSWKVGFPRKDVYELELETAFSGYTYTVRATENAETFVVYVGPVRGWLAQKLIPTVLHMAQVTSIVGSHGVFYKTKPEDDILLEYRKLTEAKTQISKEIRP